jgi:hypothetical protein
LASSLNTCAGIGVTPVHAAFRSLLQLHGQGGDGAAKARAPGAVPGSVRLVWAARTPALLDLFGATWLAPAAALVQQPPRGPAAAAGAASGATTVNPQDQGSVAAGSSVPGFSCALWCSNPGQAERGSSGGGGGRSGRSGRSTAVGPFAAPVGSAPLAWAEGRPDYRAEVAALAAHGGRALVFVCHVAAVVDHCAQLAAEFGVQLHAETFAL